MTRIRWLAATLLALPALAGGVPRPTASGAAPLPSTETKEDTAPTGRYDGEYGLWVEQDEHRLVVHWMTRHEGPGFAQILIDGRSRDSVATDAAIAHVATLRLPGVDRLVLRFGSADDRTDRTETALYPRDDDRRPGRVDPADSLFVMGDIHGEYDNLIAVLRNADLIDTNGAWTGGTAQLVVVGDMLDRGTDATRVLWYLYHLERDAARKGGHVRVLLGNHEVMVMANDLRYTTPKELHIAEAYDAPYWRLYDPNRSTLGRWLASLPAVLQVGDVLFAHGGVPPSLANTPVEQLNDSLYAYMHEPLFRRYADTTVVVAPMDSVTFNRHYDFFWDPESVLWYRGYLMGDTLGPGLQRVLEGHDATLHVVGHTPLRTILQRYGGAFIDVDMIAPATELLLLVRDGERYRRYRYTSDGPPTPLVGATADDAGSP